MTDPFLNVDTYLATLELPPKLVPYRQPIYDEIRWVFHTLYITRRVFRINSYMSVYIIFAINHFIRYYCPKHLCPYISEYELSSFYGVNPRHCWSRIHNIDHFLEERYKKKI
jgi:hypothetical protein